MPRSIRESLESQPLSGLVLSLARRAARPRRHRIAPDHRVDRPGGVMSAAADLTYPPSLPGLTRQSIPSNEFFSMDARGVSAFTRVFDALLPAHDELKPPHARAQCPVASAANFAGSAGASLPRQTTCMSGRSKRRS